MGVTRKRNACFSSENRFCPLALLAAQSTRREEEDKVDQVKGHINVKSGPYMSPTRVCTM